MSAIAQIRQQLSQFPGVAYEVDDTSISVAPADQSGFYVHLREDARESTVSCEGWHEHFASVEQAIACFLWSLTRNYRLRVVLCGGRPYAWTLQSRRDGKWVNHGTTTLIFFPFWRKHELVYLQNAHLDVPAPTIEDRVAYISPQPQGLRASTGWFAPPESHANAIGRYVAYPLGKILLRVLTLGRYPPEHRPHNFLFVMLFPWVLFCVLAVVIYS
jgi:hypothetical protein